MKCLVDANLPFKLVFVLRNKKLDVIHTDNLPHKEFTTDHEIRKVSIAENRIVITKDADFLDSHLINGIPSKLIFIATGNIPNRVLLSLIEKYFDTIIQLFDHYDLIELNNNEIVGHERIGS